VYEVRRLSDLALRLEERPGSLAFIEAHDGNLASVLTWLVEAQRRYPRARFVALLDRPVAPQDAPWSTDSSADSQDVLGVLLEAGASSVIDSPRHLQPVLTVAKLQETVERPAPPASTGSQLFLEWALSLLPWQET
jgi:hypothetical protein